MNTNPDTLDTQEGIAASLLDRYTLTCPVDNITYSPHGYVIDEDGKIYVLTKRWWHGVVMALLDVKILKDHPVEHDDKSVVLTLSQNPDEIDVYLFQRYRSPLNYIRIANGPLYGLYVTFPKDALNAQQIEALRACVMEFAENLETTVTTEIGEMSIRRLLHLATLDSDARVQEHHRNTNEE